MRSFHPCNPAILLIGNKVRSHVDGYPLIYVTSDGGVLCADCVQAERKQCCNPHSGGWHVEASGVHWEGPAELCDHCGAEIESAYGDPDADDSED